MTRQRRTLPHVIGYLKGVARGTSLVDVNGVGYSVQTPRGLVDGSDVELYVSTHVRDDRIVLYGFSSIGEKEIYEALIRVSGVGPASALALLGALGGSGIAAAIHAKNPDALGKVKGVGRKTATSIVTLCVLPNSAGGFEPRVTDLISALTSLGVPADIAQQSSQSAYQANPDGTDAELLADALARTRSTSSVAGRS